MSSVNILRALAAFCCLADVCRAEVVNVDLNLDEFDFVYAGPGILSGPGTVWNSIHPGLPTTASNLVNENGVATPLALQTVTPIQTFFQVDSWNALQDTGYEPRPAPSPLALVIRNLVPGGSYTVAVYVARFGTDMSVIDALTMYSDTSFMSPTWFPPGLLGGDYLLFPGLVAGEVSPGVGGIQIRSRYDASTPNWIAGFQIVGSFAISGSTNGPSGVTNYVSLSGSHVFPYTNWATAATTLQAAVNAAGVSNLVLAADGVYRTTLVDKDIRLESVNGPTRAVIDGALVDRCLTVTHTGAVVSGFTLRNGYAGGATLPQGGGVLISQGTLDRCAIQSNTAIVAGDAAGTITASGGGVYAGPTARLRSCLIQGNTAKAQAVPTQYGMFPCTYYSLNPGGIYRSEGGGVFGGILENCTVVGNSALADNAGYGGVSLMALGSGVYTSILENSIAMLNGSTNWLYAVGSNVCTRPMLPGGNNTTNDPQFVSTNDFHLIATSPCVDAGVLRAWMSTSMDVEGLPRALGGLVSLGAYEQARDSGLLAPFVTSPVPISAGATNTLWTTQSVISVAGDKPGNTWAMIGGGQGGSTTNGIGQTAAGTTWLAQVATSFVTTNDTRLVPFRCGASETGAVVSSGATLLRLRNSGGGPPAIWIHSVSNMRALTQISLGLGGTNNADAVAVFWASNSANGAWSPFNAPAVPPFVWTSPPLPLAFGSNVLSVCATNLAGMVTCDVRTVFRGGDGIPAVDMTNVAELVDFGVTNINVAGSNNVHVVGHLVITNSTAGASVVLPAPDGNPFRWTALVTALSPGANVITASGSNLFGAAAVDMVSITRAGADTPYAVVTSSSRAVTFGTASIVLGGSNNPHVVGGMWASNAANGHVYAFAAPSFKPHRWTSPPITVSPGTNVITFSGTNVFGTVSSSHVVIHRLTNTLLYVSASNATPRAPYLAPTSAATSIQSALLEAGHGDTILVDRGTYSPFSLLTGVTVRSLMGPTNTFISGGGSARCLYLSHSNAWVEGFTLHSGYVSANAGDMGGAGAVVRSGATLRGCIVRANVAVAFTSYGDLCSPVWTTYYNDGGGVYCDNGGVVQSCLIISNSASRHGGGVYAGSNSVIQNCTIADNSAPTNGGGLFLGQRCSVENSIVYFNIATLNPNMILFGASNTVTYTCTTPSIQGTGNFSIDPDFQSRAQSNYRLKLSSACINTGTNAPWIGGTTELDGKPRRLNGVVDLGAYEEAIQASLRVFLQGPYDPDVHLMTSLLPETPTAFGRSPYAADARIAANVPSNVVDWVLVQVRNQSNGPAIVSRSAFLESTGYILDDFGSTGVIMDVVFGQRVYLQVSHRNHLPAMSVQPVDVTGWTVSYDFTPGATSYYGGTNGPVEVEPGVWALRAGDVDGDGVVSPADEMIRATQE